MKRIDGFLDLDKHFNNTLKSTNNQVIDGDYAHQYWMIIDGEKYFFKIIDDPYAELIAYEVANFLGIDATPYDLAIYHKQEGVISKNFHKEDCRYISGKKILEDYLRYFSNEHVLKEMGMPHSIDKLPKFINNLEIIWQAIEQRYVRLGIKVNMEEIMNSIFDQFTSHILSSQTDGMPHNWEIEEDLERKRARVVQMFDNENCFKEMYPRSALTTNFKDLRKNNYEILEEFLCISSKEYIDRFIEKFNMLTINKFIDLIKIVETKINCAIPENFKKTYITVFTFNRMCIEEILTKKGLNKSR